MSKFYVDNPKGDPIPPVGKPGVEILPNTPGKGADAKVDVTDNSDYYARYGKKKP